MGSAHGFVSQRGQPSGRHSDPLNPFAKEKMAAYETYETDNDYDTMEMQNTPAAERVAKAVNPRPQIERKSSNRKMNILLAATCAILLLHLLAIGGGVAVFLKSNCGESAATTTTPPP